MKARDCLTGLCLLVPLFARSQQAHVSLDCNPQKNTKAALLSNAINWAIAQNDGRTGN
jgi:hypothetical protein